ncbi:myo-inosose-2 dehydratase [Sinanaerobacter chloroacetimidivorans]|uniref:Myo-inosose-2 dehydratase n=1 Tax=Sinanaerobacter chloroacetimidivorans TaxID=2818044 RepID=A0A8J7W3U2_9FIRM|nr:myo-inosose-2 dehydratase [Sinanaerobacter chloroacetimidivorans]MBR0598653.1 myo-inosose-2 dehydratase [Sinanaerobacter chloroacetimidivorans]
MFQHVKLGIAPIGWTNDDMPQLGGDLTFEQMISEAALAGFQGTEVGGKFPTDPKVLKKALDLRGIAITSQWFSSFLCSDPYEENEKAFIAQLDFLEALGATRINVCELTRCLFAEECSMFGDNKPIATDGEWEKLCDGLNRLGKIASGRGFKLCFHHHMATVVQTLAETKRLMDHTDPRYVYLCYDTGHFTFSKEDAVEAANLFAPRIGHVHLKDIRPEKMEQAYKDGFKFRKAVLEGCFTVPGDGCIDFSRVFKALDRVGYEGWFIVEAEQDPNLANPFEYALMSRKYIRETAGI